MKHYKTQQHRNAPACIEVVAISDKAEHGEGWVSRWDWATLEAAQEVAEPKKPEECANGCPPLQVCDYCQTAEQAEQKPVVKIHKHNEFQTLGSLNLPIGTKLYAAPVRTKDLTDKEIRKLWNDAELDITWFARAVIAKFKEKNRG